MVTFEELKAKYPVREVPPHGNCLVVPEREFLDGWESELKAQGIAVLYQFLPGGPCVVLKVKDQKLDVDEPRTVYEPKRPDEPRQAYSPLEGAWKPEEDEFIISLYNTGLKYEGIFEKTYQKFPNRTPNAVLNRIQHLQRSGKIPFRMKNKRRTKQPRLEEPEREESRVHKKWSPDEITGLKELWNQGLTLSKIAAKFPGRSQHSVDLHLGVMKRQGVIKPRVLGFRAPGARVQIPATQEAEKAPAAAVPTDVCTDESTETRVEEEKSEQEAVLLLREIRDLLRITVKLAQIHQEHELLDFEVYCRKCKRLTSASGEDVWSLCPVCGDPLIVWNVKEVNRL